MINNVRYRIDENGPFRWTKRRKAEILDALAKGLITPTQLEQRYGIGAEELAYWRRAFVAGGVNGLRISAIDMRRQALQKPRG